ncbi:MAG: leucine-rich repeat domain-containing protein [Myxococcota bacterium]|nr:leucine-rich repeat domain-containing protein [Myxococcota bacterium]
MKREWMRTHRQLMVIFSGAMLLANLGCPQMDEDNTDEIETGENGNNCDGVISFEDEHLEAAVRSALGISEGDLKLDDVLLLDTLRAPELEISSLKGLECLTELTQLSLWGNHIEDITPLSGLVHLMELDISWNDVRDLSPLLGLKKLVYFGADENPISDLHALSGLENLESLFLRLGQVSDVSPLSGLPKLKELNLDGNVINDIAPLSRLTTLRRLLIRENPIGDLSVLAQMTQLEDLRIAGDEMDLALLAHHSNLQVLDVEDCDISDLGPIAGLTTLKELWLRDNRVVDLAPIEGLVNLEFLLLVGNHVRDLSSLLNNPGMGQGDRLMITDIPIDCDEQGPVIEELLQRGLEIEHDCK